MSAPRVEIRKINGIPRLYVNGEAIPAITYRNRIHHDFGYMKKFADSGHRVFFMTHPRHWDEPESEYWKAVDENVRTILGYNEDVYLILGMYLAVDEKWAKAHRGHIARYKDRPAEPYVERSHGGLITMPYSLFSKEFEKEGVRQVKAHVNFARKHPLGHRIIGFFIEAGAAQEWIPFTRGDQMDYAPVVTTAFREWLRERYRTNARLRAAWKDRRVTLETAKPPAQEVQNAPTRGDFFDPAAGRRVIDFQQCYMENIGDRIHAVCRAAKQRGEGRLVGIFHEPPMEVGAHDHAWQQALEDPNIDFYAGPTCYESRKAGMPTPVHHLVDSLRLFNKLFFTEEDTRPHTVEKIAGAHAHAYTKDESRQVISRTILHCFVKGVLGWYWDFQFRWFTEPWFFRMFKELQDIGVAVEKARPRSAAEVAVFVDEGSIPYSVGDNRLLTNLGHRMLIHEINRIGCPHDIYLFDHVRRPDLPDYRLYIFLNAYRATEAQRRAVRRLRRDGHVLFFPHASGFINDDARKTASAANMADLIGMDFKEIDARRPTVVVTNDRDHPLVNALPVGHMFGQFPRYLRSSLRGGTDDDPLFPPMLPVSPIFCVDDAEAVTLGYYAIGDLPEAVATSRRKRRPPRRDDVHDIGFAVKHGKDWASVYAGVVAMTSELLRGMAKFAGAHVYLDTDDTFYANERLIVLHTNWRPGDTRTIRLPRRTNVYDLLDRGKLVARSARELTIPVKPKTTYAFFLGTKRPEL
jgi:hypothetical protein